MAISRVWGTCNGSDVIFSLVSGNTYQVAVPATTDNIYYVEIWAEDDAGNTAYVATMSVSYDIRNLCSAVKFTKIGNRVMFDEFQDMIRQRRMTRVVGNIQSSVITDRYKERIDGGD